MIPILPPRMPRPDRLESPGDWRVVQVRQQGDDLVVLASPLRIGL